MEEGGGTMVYHKTFKPQGKMRRRIKDLRISRFSYLDTAGCRAQPDLSHNESVRLAVDSLLTQGLEAYHKMLSAEGEVDFLSELEKTYVLQNGTDVSAGGAPDAFDDQFESLSAFSQTTLTYKMTSADSDRTLTPCRQNGVTSTNNGSDEPTVQIYFPSDIRAAGIKDVVRNFIREAKMALAIVMECFSDVELLCDVLVACKKRNVSVHLLLDRSNLDLFVDMWRELRLDGKNFPKFSVRSVVGHTYCARTGRRLTGQIAESFVISDWTAALTGTYSFSWLSGQVHRCHAVLVKGSAVLPFHQEFHRLNSSSTPVLGFATYMSVPQTLPLYIYNSVHACQKDQDDDDEVKLAWTEDTQNPNTQTRAKPEPVAKLQSSVSERTEDKDKDNTQNPQLELEPPNSLVTTDAKPLEKLSNHNSGSSDPPSDSLISTIQSDLSSLTITSVAGQVLESNPQQTAPPLSKQHRLLRTYLKPEVANRHGAEGPGFQQRQRYGLFRVLGTAARTNMQRRDWSCPQNLKPRVNLQSTCSQALSLSIPVKKDKNARFFSFLTHAKEHILKPHESFHNRPQAQDQPDQYHYRSHFQSHLSGEFLVSGPSINIRMAQHQPGSTMLSPHIRTIRTTSEPDPTQFRLAAHHSSVGSAYEAVQRARWRSCLGSLRQSIRLNHRYHILNLVQEHD